MKILLSSYVFSPSVGGIETVSELLAPEFIRAGHEVVLVTHTLKEDKAIRTYRVERRPSRLRLIELVRWCDVYFQNNISLQYAWPLLLVRKPWVVTHQIWLNDFTRNRRTWKARMKRVLLKHGRNVTVSRSIADDLPLPSTVVGNPYDPEIFCIKTEIPRNRELVFLGRLVSDKGVDLIIESLAQLRYRDLHPRLTIIGSGPEEAALRQLARDRQVDDQIKFVGTKKPREVAELLNAHQILVVPSRCPEPFGIVALEGIACGCVVVASQGGGLPDAVGSCGRFFDLSNRAALTDVLLNLLTNPALRCQLPSRATQHLRQFEPETVAAKYLYIFERARAAQPCR